MPQLNDDYRPNKFALSNSEVRATGILCQGAMLNIARELLEARQRIADMTRAPSPVPAPIKCKYGDPGCPCQDGDSCHYEDTATTKAMTPPVPAPESVGEKLIEALKRIVSDFETDYVLDGVVVDDPSHTHRIAWEQARAALALAEESK